MKSSTRLRVRLVEQIGLNINEVQQKRAILNEVQDVFEGLGCVEGEYTIKLKVNSQPTIQPQRNVPLRLRNKLKATLDDLERRDIITKVEEPVDWVSNLVVVEKANNTLRLCLDPPDLNQAIEREDFKPSSFERPTSCICLKCLVKFRDKLRTYRKGNASNCFWV